MSMIVFLYWLTTRLATRKHTRAGYRRPIVRSVEILRWRHDWLEDDMKDWNEPPMPVDEQPTLRARLTAHITRQLKLTYHTLPLWVLDADTLKEAVC